MADDLKKVTDVDERSQFTAKLQKTVDAFDKENFTSPMIRMALIKGEFLNELTSPESSGNVTVAVMRLHNERGIKITAQCLYLWKAKDPVFSDNWDVAMIFGVHRLKGEAIYKLREQVLSGDVSAIKFTLTSLNKHKLPDEIPIVWGEPVTPAINNTQINNIEVTVEKRKELNAKFEKFIEADTLVTPNFSSSDINVTKSK